MRRLIWLIAAVTVTACGANPTPTPTSAPTLEPLPFAPLSGDDAFCPQPRGWFVYVSQAGDTLADIAARANSSVHELATANCLQNPRALRAGMRLYVPQRIGD